VGEEFGGEGVYCWWIHSYCGKGQVEGGCGLVVELMVTRAMVNGDRKVMVGALM